MQVYTAHREIPPWFPGRAGGAGRGLGEYYLYSLDLVLFFSLLCPPGNK